MGSFTRHINCIHWRSSYKYLRSFIIMKKKIHAWNTLLREQYFSYLKKLNCEGALAKFLVSMMIPVVQSERLKSSQSGADLWNIFPHKVKIFMNDIYIIQRTYVIMKLELLTLLHRSGPVNVCEGYLFTKLFLCTTGFINDNSFKNDSIDSFFLHDEFFCIICQTYLY